MRPEFASLGRFGVPAQQVASVLAAGPRVPLAIRREVQARFGGDLGPGTLFGTIARLERRGFIEALGATRAPRAYRLTALGVDTLAAQLAALSRPSRSSVSAVQRSLAR